MKTTDGRLLAEIRRLPYSALLATSERHYVSSHPVATPSKQNRSVRNLSLFADVSTLHFRLDANPRKLKRVCSKTCGQGASEAVS